MATREPTLRQAAVARAGVAVAGAAIAFWLYSVLAVYPRPAPSGPWAGPVLTNLLLYAAFGLHHSVFARDAVRDAVGRIVGGRLERASYVWMASVLLAAMCGLWRPVPGLVWEADGLAGLPFRLCQLAGAALAWRAVGLVDALDLVGLRQLTSPAQPNGDARPGSDAALQNAGPYRWVRHPMHLGGLLIVWAVPTMTATGLVFAAATTAYVAVAVPFEERSMRRRAPAAYDAFVRAVRWRLVPLIY